MSKLTEFYQIKSQVFDGNDDSGRWDAVEEKLIREEVLPEMMELLKPVLSQVKSPLAINISYDPNGNLAISMTRNCIQAIIPIGGGASTFGNTDEVSSVVAEPVDEANEAVEVGAQVELETILEPEPEPTKTRAKSVGYTVYINGEEIRCKNGKLTFFAALRRIGLRRILDDYNRHEVIHSVEGEDVGLVWHTQYKYTEGKNIGDSPQEELDNLYVYKGLSHDQKIDDLLKLGRFYDDIDLYVVWDDGRKVTADETEESMEITDVVEVNDTLSTLTAKEEADDSLRGRFRKFMCKSVQRGTANNYITVLENHVKPFIIEYVDSNATDSIFSYTTPDDVNTCIEYLSEIDAFNDLNDYKHRSLTAALQKYKEFIESEE